MKYSNYFTRSALFSLMVGASLLSGCSGLPQKQANELPAQHSYDSVVHEDTVYAIDVYDPWEGFNRGVYRFNAGFDQYVFLPVVGAYETVLPDVVEDSVSNFFNNLFEITNFANSALQLKPNDSAKTAGRFVINSTAGIVGLFDVATGMGFYENKEDFGQTLGHYGVGEGPYVILPFLGPSNLRDATGTIVDAAIMSSIDVLDLDDNSGREVAYYALQAIDARHKKGFRYYQTGSPFEYELVRKLYTDKRKLDISR
ncbi:MAG: VacJ family lipoprotein [Cycloclasticus sp.]|nr:VacJ family lipoprotein [Cycloclasticus sp.]